MTFFHHGRALTLACGLAVVSLHDLTVRQNPGVQAGPLHVLRIVGGPAGSETNGVFVVTDERSIFSRSTDKEVIVFFQWDGVPGTHKLAAQWRSPDGGLTSTSAFDYAARDRRFGAYWRLPLSPTLPLGTWSIEATVDGQPAGRFTFEVRDEKIEPTVIKRPLAQAELYDRLEAIFVVLERTGAGRDLEPAGGALLASGRVFTSMAAIDAVDGVRAILPDGSRRELPVVMAYSRSQDWAILQGSLPEVPRSTVGSDTIKIGDRVFSIEGSASGGRVLSEGSVTGQTEESGIRLFLATFLTGTETRGAPVVNEYGELLGLVGGPRIAGATTLLDQLRFRGELKGAPVLPMASMRQNANAQPHSFSELQERGELVLPMTGQEHVLSGGFARDIARRPTVAPLDQRDHFSGVDKNFVAFVTWSPIKNLKGQTLLRIYDADNRLVVESKPAKADFRKGTLAFSSWQLSVPGTAGVYRADVLFDGRPAWRGFVRITR